MLGTGEGSVDLKVDLLLRARGGSMMEDKSNGPGNVTVTEMPPELLLKTVYDITRWCWKRFQRRVQISSIVEVVEVGFLEEA